MNFATLCSGIGAPEVALRNIGGWNQLFHSEIEPFPCAVLKQRFPGVPNYGDMTKWREWPHHDLDLLIAGTPCQAFSVAGLRGGLDDARGNLTLEFANYVNAVRPRFILWENVPGVLSDRSNAFGCLLAGLAGSDVPLLPPGGRWASEGLAAGPKRQIAWRVLDAQYFGVPQRRRRVWLCAGDIERGAGNWACATALFPEPQSVRRDNPSCGAAREEVAGRAGGGSHWSGGPHPALNQSHNIGGIGMSDQELFSQRGAGLVSGAVSAKWAKGTGGPAGDECYNLVAHSLRGDGFDASEDGTGRGTPLVAIHDMRGNGDGATCPTLTGDHASSPTDYTPVVFYTAQITSPGNYSNPKPGQPAPPLNTAAQHHVALIGGIATSTVRAISPAITSNYGKQCDNSDTAAGPNVVMMPVVFEQDQQVVGVSGGPVGFSLRATPSHSRDKGDGGVNTTLVAATSAVRRLTPRECERLQGFPDDWTLVQHRGKPAADGPRYKAIGNSMAVPCVEFIVRNLQEADNGTAV